MGRTANTPAQATPAPELLPAAVQRIETAQNELTALEQQQAERVRTVALQIGYEGSLTVGALEDEIRFYQRRTVEAILETGKRLLVLKEMTPRGEFDARAELLGFSRRTAYRFMQAAFKTANSAKLAQISTQIKNGSAFLELVTHDDDELQALEGMDDVDRMSASQLRAKLRESRAEAEAKEQRLRVVRDRLEQAEQKADLFQALPPDERLKEIQAQATDVVDTVLGHINGSFRAAVMAITQHDDVDRTPTATGWLLQIQDALDELRDLYNLRPKAADGVPEWERWAQQQAGLKTTQQAN